MVAKFTQPNFTTQSAAQYKANIDGGFAVHHRLAGPLAAHEQDQGSPQPDLSVRIDAGFVYNGSTLTEVAAQTVSGFTIPSSGQHRIDRVVVDPSTGVCSRIAGTPATGSPSASPPDITTGKYPVCRVLITSADTVITDAMIADERVPVPVPFVDSQPVVVGSVDSTKKLRFEVDGFTTGQTRVATVPNSDFTLVGVALTQTLTDKSLTSPAITGSPTAAGATWTDLGAVTTADINGGSIDGSVIGAASSAAGTFTTATSTTFSLTGSALPAAGMGLSSGNTAIRNTSFTVAEFIKPATDNSGSIISQWSSNAGLTHKFAGVSNGGFNGANTAFWIGADNTSGRSINGAGTINASGADYAEYERKRADCGTIAKGDIVGFDADGLLTDKWALAVTFGVKSTDPSIVGGDAWGRSDSICPLDGLPIGARPSRPPEPMPAPAEPQQPLMEAPGDEPDELDQEAHEQWLNRSARFIAVMRAYEAERGAREERMKVYASERAAYDAALLAWEEMHAAWCERLEAARCAVDRVAYAGKVPVNVSGALPGQWISAAAGPGGKIIGLASSTRGDSAVGRVRRILPDGRPEIVVAQ